MGTALHSETEEPFVVYHREGSSESASTELRVRPVAMWNERVVRDEYDGPRFVVVPSTAP